jgi:hypothetical protein
MSVVGVNAKVCSATDVTWTSLIRDAEMKVEMRQREILALEKSIVFFKKQETAGAVFPTLGKDQVKRQENCS